MLGIREDKYYIKKRNVNLNTSKVHTHMLRHTFATRWIEAGRSPYALQRILGHKQLKTTMDTYTSIYNSFKETEFKEYEEYKRTQNLYNTDTNTD